MYHNRSTYLLIKCAVRCPETLLCVSEEKNKSGLVYCRWLHSTTASHCCLPLISLVPRNTFSLSFSLLHTSKLSRFLAQCISFIFLLFHFLCVLYGEKSFQFMLGKARTLHRIFCFPSLRISGSVDKYDRKE